MKEKQVMLDKMVDRNYSIAVVVPTLNEEHNLPFVLEGLKSVDVNRVLVIDGKSTDKTVEIAQNFGVDVVFQDGKGKGNAICQVFSNGDLETDAVVLIDADGSMNPEEIPIFVEKLRSGFDVVKGSRFIGSAYSEDMNTLRRIGNLFFVAIIRCIWGKDYTDLCYGYMAFSKESIKKLAPLLKSQNFEIETEIFIKAKKLGLKVVEVPSVELKRKNGNSNLRSLKDGFRILKSIIIETLWY